MLHEMSRDFDDDISPCIVSVQTVSLQFDVKLRHSVKHVAIDERYIDIVILDTRTD
jgi:hypothetical protein